MTSKSAVKRFLERWLADPSFRAALQAVGPAPDATVPREELRLLWDEEYRAGKYGGGLTAEGLAGEPEGTQLALALIEENKRHRLAMRDDSEPADRRFRVWRARQVARARTEFRAAYDLNTPHVTFAIELSKGCSIGCWFCGVSAPKLDGHFPATPENRTLLRDVLGVLARVVGRRAAGRGFLYWATDPFDHPDYETFCDDFEETLGRFPLTTTAQPQKNLERTRRFIASARERGAKVRFSILSLPLLARVHAAFTAEELASVELIPLNEGAMVKKASTGRARERYQHMGIELDFSVDPTISCVSGFLLNMVERSVKLITPCRSSDRWPLGYYIYEEAQFSDAADFDRALESMMGRHMTLAAPADVPLRFRTDLKYETLNDEGFRVRSPHAEERFEKNFFLREAAELISAGDQTYAGLLSHFNDKYGIAPPLATGLVETLFRNGFMDEEPRV